jgi:hypothetical protein
MYTGTIIKESLKDASILGEVHILTERTASIDNPAPDQPVVWNLVRFEVEDDKAPNVAEAMSKSLHEGTWYVDFSSENITFVVFPGKVFGYVKGDAVGREEVREYGRSLGIPEAQLDWS